MDTTKIINELLESGEENLHRKIVGEVEKELIKAVLVQCYGNISKTALILGLNRTTVRNKVTQYQNEHRQSKPS